MGEHRRAEIGKGLQDLWGKQTDIKDKKEEPAEAKNKLHFGKQGM